MGDQNVRGSWEFRAELVGGRKLVLRTHHGWDIGAPRDDGTQPGGPTGVGAGGLHYILAQDPGCNSSSVFISYVTLYEPRSLRS